MKHTTRPAGAAQEAATLDRPPGALRVLQLTDTHLFADPQRSLLGVNTLDSFRDVIARANGHGQAYDLVLATGDLVHDASAAGYARLNEELAALHTPVYCLPGNHDEHEMFRRHIGQGEVSYRRLIDIGPWRIVMLDSTVPGEDGGNLAESELAFLAAALGDEDRPTLVCLHHQPLPLGSAWIDTMAVTNGAALLRLVDAHPQVRGVLWGHVHQEYDQRRGNVRLLGTPSTCVQFAPGTADFQVDNSAPGYRELVLRPDGTIDSAVFRLATLPQGLQLASAGY